MKACPYCADAPLFHYARNLSTLPNGREGPAFFMLAGCRHANDFIAARRVIAKAERTDIEAKWDAEAERLFAEYTKPRPWTDAMRAEWKHKNPDQPLPARAEGWTEIERARFREKLWPTPPAVIPAELILI